jgi:two-component system, chemotaxis family, protein-glutamate methylesterase/glutaminase
MEIHPRYELVTIAASAGGIQALWQVLSSLPVDFPLPIAIVQHRTARAPDRLASVLGRKTRLHVARAVEGEPLSAGRVYLAPPDAHLTVRPDKRFGFMDGRKIHHVRSSADPLMASAAASLGPHVLAVVLTGGDADASEGVKAVKAAGGTVIAQDEASSQCFGMPGAAIRTGAVDFILPLTEIGPMLVRLSGWSATRPIGVDRIKVSGGGP